MRTKHYHRPLSREDEASILIFNQRFSQLDKAIVNLTSDTAKRITGTAGENIADRDAIYLDHADNKIYRMDADDTSPSLTRIRGFADGAAVTDTSVIMVLGGILNGFSGLTPWQAVYAGTTAGGITQTKPSPSLGGTQICVAEMGFAISATAVFIRPKPIQYEKRGVMLLDGTLTVVHAEDAIAYQRRILAYFTDTITGSSLATYASSNQDVDVELRGPVLAGSTAATGSQTGLSSPIGDVGGTDYRIAQSFQLSASGQLSQFKFTLIANAGSPTGSLDWEIRADSGGNPTGTVLSSGSIANGSVVASAVNTVNISGGPILSASTTYWLVLISANNQVSNVRWNWDSKAGGTYANGEGAFSSDGGGAWTKDGRDTSCEVTVSPIVTKDKLAQGFQIAASANMAAVELWLKKVGTPTGNLTAKIYSDSGGNPNTLLGTSATVVASSLSTSYGTIIFGFDSLVALTLSTQYHIVLETSDSQSNTNYIVWGADASSPSYANGEMKEYASSAWSALSKDAIFDVKESITYHPQRLKLDRWTGTHADMVSQYGDASALNSSTNTTFKCKKAAGFADVTVVVEIY